MMGWWLATERSAGQKRSGAFHALDARCTCPVIERLWIGHGVRLGTPAQGLL